jgi:hypothetical protein
MTPSRQAYPPKPNSPSPGMNPFPASAPSKPPVSAPNNPAPNLPLTAPAQGLPPKDQTGGHDNTVANDASHGHLTPGDTIYIDREGNLKHGD